MIRSFADQRATLGNVLISIDAGLVGVLSIALAQSGAGAARGLAIPITVALVLSGAYGVFATRTLFERGNFHQRRSLYQRDRLEELLPATELQQLSHLAAAEHSLVLRKQAARQYHVFNLSAIRSKRIEAPKVEKTWIERRDFALWEWIHLGVVLAGISLGIWTMVG